MVSYLIRRLLSAVTVLLVVSAISFAVIQLPPGDFTDIYKAQLMTQGGLTETEAEAAAEEMRARYGLDVPVPVQYVNWIIGIVTRGEFGYSFRYKEDVGSLIAERLPRTIGLAAAAHATSTIVGLLVGIFVGQRQYSLSDNVAAVVAFILTSLPRFFLALVIIYILVFTFDQQSVTSFYSPEYVVAPWSWGKFLDLLKHVWPVIAIAGLGGVARNLRVMRGNLLDVLNAQYVVTARSKGITERRVVNRHAVPNALHPIVAYQGTAIPYMVQGELEAAIVLSLPTVAPMFYGSLRNQDIYITGSILLLYGALLVAGNLLSDIFLAVLDPRIRYS
ncbi:MAG: ABC transporter permease [Caldilineaceae bacterium]|nr:ABC transporter permease [Caldilineaceae bacterium]